MSDADGILARIRELTGPDSEVGLRAELVDEFVDLVAELDRTLSNRGPLPKAWAGPWPMTIPVNGKPTAVLMQRGAQ